MDIVREKEIRELMRTCRGENCGEEHFNEIRDLGDELKKNKQFNRLIDFLNVLGNKVRLMIVKVLCEKGELCVCELEVLLDKSQPSISHHLRNLERIGLIRGWKKGRFTFYELQKDVFKQYNDLFSIEFNNL